MSLAKNSLLFTAGTSISRVSGLVRDMVLAATFGSSNLLEAFFVANRIPNLFREMLAEGALGGAFTKVYTSVASEDTARARKLIFDMLRISACMLVLISLLGFLLAPYLVRIFTLYSDNSGRPDTFVAYTVGLTRVLFPFLGVAILSSVVMGVLYERGRFFISALAPIFLNFGYIFGALVLGGYFAKFAPSWVETSIADPRIVGLAVGVLLGGVGHFLIQFYFVWKDLIKGETWDFGQQWFSADVRNVIRIMIPAAIAASSGPINLLVVTNFATSLGTGAVSWLSYAFRLFQLPVGLFGVAVGAAVLPALTRKVTAAKGHMDRSVSLELENALEFILWVMVPCCVFLQVNSIELVELLFERGKFSHNDTLQTASALYAYSFGVVSYGLVKVLMSFYYAAERTSFAMKVSIVAIVVNFVCNLFLVKVWGHVGLAATAAATLSFNALILFLGVKASGIHFNTSNLLKTLGYISVAFLTSYYLQSFCRFFVGGLDLGVVYMNSMKTAGLLVLNGIVVCAVFGAMAMLKMGWSPKYVSSKIKGAWKRN